MECQDVCSKFVANKKIRFKLKKKSLKLGMSRCLKSICSKQKDKIYTKKIKMVWNLECQDVCSKQKDKIYTKQIKMVWNLECQDVCSKSAAKCWHFRTVELSFVFGATRELLIIKRKNEIYQNIKIKIYQNIEIKMYKNILNENE